jgi:hypothetical protein
MILFHLKICGLANNEREHDRFGWDINLIYVNYKGKNNTYI